MTEFSAVMTLVYLVSKHLQLYAVGYGHINTLQSVLVADQFTEDQVTILSISQTSKVYKNYFPCLVQVKGEIFLVVLPLL